MVIGLHLTSHALSRALERLGCNTVAEAEELLRSPAIARAAEFGAPFVRLPSGHRVVLIGNRIVTVLPKNCAMSCLAPARDPNMAPGLKKWGCARNWPHKIGGEGG